VGHLDVNKDPLTVLDGVSLAVAQFPGLRLWCCFGTARLRRAVEKRIARNPLLRERVTLLGNVPHADIETLMRAADVLVSGSRREGSGYALIEAMACGLPVVVTSIPSFRALLGDSGIGEQWTCGDAVSLQGALTRLLAQPQAPLRAAVRAHFERELSMTALGRKWCAAYSELGAAIGNS